MQRARLETPVSARQASAQEMQVWAHSEQASMQRDEGVIDDAGRFGMAGQHLAHRHAGLLLRYGINARLRPLVTGC